MFRTVIAPTALLSLIALTACAGSSYDKIRGDAVPWTEAQGECQRAAEAVPQTPLRQITMRHAYDECMRERGWERGEQVPHRAYRRI